MGENTVTCQVTAEDGTTTRTYTILVTKTEEAPQETEESSAEANAVGSGVQVTVDEGIWQVAGSFDAAALPEGFTCPADRQKPWGTAHAILCCKNVVKEPFAVVNADDYYGRSAFKKIYDELSSASEDYCMVGFRLKNTLTENGTVSRGVCVTDNNALESVTEYTKIRSDCSFTEDDGKTWNALSPDTVVSMNLWGFRPDVFKYIEDGFVSFLKEKLNVPKSEYYLPSVVSSLIESGTKKVNVLVAEDKWYGVTYKEDKPAVVASIGELIDKGYYDGI